jgi:protein-S-isoprenylcysteine O-methyltransferase Ste14
MYHGMMRGSVRLERFPAILWDALLLAQFPLAHSFLLSRRGSAWLLRLAPRSVSQSMVTTSFTLVASFQLLLLYLAWAPVGPIWWQASGSTRVAVTCLYLSTWLLLGKAMSDAGLAVQTGFLGWRSVYRGERPRYGDMPQKGLFRHIRHPVYLAFALIVWCVPVWTPDQLVLALWFTSYCLLGPLLKEARYLRRYGETFASYRSRVPYFLPGLRWPSRSSSMKELAAKPDSRQADQAQAEAKR